MKRIIPFLLCTAIVLASAGCSSSPSNNTSSAASNTLSSSTPTSTSSAAISSPTPSVASSATSSEPSSGTSSTKGIEVNNGILSDTITLPASMTKGQSIKDIKASATKQGITDVTQNEDGSVTYKMTKATHQKLIDNTKQATSESLNKLKSSKDFPYIKDISYNDNFTKVTLIIDKSSYEDTYKEILALDVGLQTYFYQVINGTKENSIKTTIDLQDQKSKKVFDTITYPESAK